MKIGKITEKDRAMARVCVNCPVCRHARKKQKGPVYMFVRTIERGLCPFCRAYEKVHGSKAHEPFPSTKPGN
ncbi:MAG: hypothetical protein NTZ57_04450 [Deltaproteobacteria bacterium]|nr:hypothetical protein [Deltaproteobacteria bacterium]